MKSFFKLLVTISNTQIVIGPVPPGPDPIRFTILDYISLINSYTCSFSFRFVIYSQSFSDCH